MKNIRKLSQDEIDLNKPTWLWILINNETGFIDGGLTIPEDQPDPTYVEYGKWYSCLRHPLRDHHDGKMIKWGHYSSGDCAARMLMRLTNVFGNNKMNENKKVPIVCETFPQWVSRTFPKLLSKENSFLKLAWNAGVINAINWIKSYEDMSYDLELLLESEYQPTVKETWICDRHSFFPGIIATGSPCIICDYIKLI